MSNEEKSILQITARLEDLGNTQIGCDEDFDEELGFCMWGGKDRQGDVTRWLAKGKPGMLSSLRLTGNLTTGRDQIAHLDAFGNIYGGPVTLDDLILLPGTENQLIMSDGEGNVVAASLEWDNNTYRLFATNGIDSISFGLDGANIPQNTKYLINGTPHGHLENVEKVAGFENPYDVYVDFINGEFVARAPISGKVTFYSGKKYFSIPNGSPLLKCTAPTDSRRVRLYFDENGQLVCPLIDDSSTYYNNSINRPSVIDAYIDSSLGEISMVRAMHHHNIDPRIIESAWRTGSTKYISGVTPDCTINGTQIGFTGGEFRDVDRKCTTPVINKTTAIWPVYYSEGADAMVELRLRRLADYSLNNKPFIIDSEIAGLGSTTGRLIYNYKSGSVFAVGVVPASGYVWIHAFYADGLLGSIIFVTPQAYYTNRTTARAAVENEISRINLNPYARVSIPLFSFLVNATGQIQWADDASTEKWVDHRTDAIGSSGGGSSTVFPGALDQILKSDGIGGVVASTAKVNANGDLDILSGKKYLINGLDVLARRDTTNDFTQHNVFSSGRIGVGSAIRDWRSNYHTIDMLGGTVFSTTTFCGVMKGMYQSSEASGSLYKFTGTTPGIMQFYSEDGGYNIWQTTNTPSTGATATFLERFKIAPIGITVDGSIEPFIFASGSPALVMHFKPVNYAKWSQEVTASDFNLWHNSSVSGSPSWTKKFSITNGGTVSLTGLNPYTRSTRIDISGYAGFLSAANVTDINEILFGHQAGSDNPGISVHLSGWEQSIIFSRSDGSMFFNKYASFGDLRVRTTGSMYHLGLANGGNRLLTIDNAGLVGAAFDSGWVDTVLYANGSLIPFKLRWVVCGKVCTISAYAIDRSTPVSISGGSDVNIRLFNLTYGGNPYNQIPPEASYIYTLYRSSVMTAMDNTSNYNYGESGLMQGSNIIILRRSNDGSHSATWQATSFVPGSVSFSYLTN